MSVYRVGSLTTTDYEPGTPLVPPVVAAALDALPAALRDTVGVVPVDPELSDTAATETAYALRTEQLANCVIVAGKREGVERVAACVVLATTRADVNATVKRLLDVRKASFLPLPEAVERTAMEYGGITPIGLPAAWRILVDRAVAESGPVVVGSGIRASKIVLPGSTLAALPGVEIVDGLGLPIAS
jgi:prolyl-tRNA editing enzyme YbaK/EbsC (Cys-tRNA(Pro) deacylase)